MDTQRMLARLDAMEPGLLGVSGPEADMTKRILVIFDEALPDILREPDGLQQLRTMGLENLADVLSR
jgi:hypothetical protein